MQSPVTLIRSTSRRARVLGLILLGPILLALFLAACNWSGTDNANTRDNAVVDKQQELYQQNQPIPFFNFSMPRDVYIQIYQAKNEARQTVSITRSFTGQVNFKCNSIGFPIPGDAQLTNPEQVTVRNFGGAGWEAGVVEQPEPDGLYGGHNTTGTWILCVRPDGQVSPHYTEDAVSTWPYAINIDPNGLVTDAGGESTINLNIQGGTVGPIPSGAVPTPIPSP